jgi:hypothetical protein
MANPKFTARLGLDTTEFNSKLKSATGQASSFGTALSRIA